VLAGIPSWELEDFVAAKFYLILAAGNWCIWIREKMLRILLSSLT